MKTKVTLHYFELDIFRLFLTGENQCQSTTKLQIET